MNRCRSVIAVAMACVLAGCQYFSPTPKVGSPYSDEPLKYVDAKLGYSYVDADPAKIFEKDFATLLRLYVASDACDEAKRGAHKIKIDGQPLDATLPDALSALPPSTREAAGTAPVTRGPRSVETEGVDCSRIYLDFFETAAEVSDVACDEFIERLWAKQRDLRLTSDYTNIASGAASAAVGLFSLGSVFGSIVGLTTVALNEAFKSNATNLLFSLDAGEIRSLIYKQKSLVREKIDEASGIGKLSEAKIRVRDYFLACTPASISEYVGNIIAEASKTGQEVGFLGRGPGNQAQQQAAVSTITAIGEEVGPLLGNGTAMSAKEVAALFAFLSPEVLSGENKDEYGQRAVHYLKQAGRIAADEKDIEPSTTTLDKRIAEIKKEAKPAIDDAEAKKRAKVSISTQVRSRLERIRWYSQLGALVEDYIATLPPVPAASPAPAPAAEPVPDVNEGLFEPVIPGTETMPTPPAVVTPNAPAADAASGAGTDMNPAIFGDR